jgi:hypothetical protein
MQSMSIEATGFDGKSRRWQERVVNREGVSANFMNDLVRAHLVKTEGIPAWALDIHQVDADDDDTETDVTSFTFAIDYGIVMVWNRNTLSAHGELKGDLIWTLNHDEESFVFRDPTSENFLIQVLRHKINYCEYSDIHKIDIRTGRRTEVTKLPTLHRQRHATCMNLLPNSTLLVVTWCGGKMYVIDTSAATEHDPIVCTYTLPNDTADKGYSERFDKNGDERFNNDMFLSQPVLWENDPSLLVLVHTNLCIRLINCSARIGTSVWASEDHMAPVKNVRREQSFVVGMSEQFVFMWEDVSNEDITHGRITAVNLADGRSVFHTEPSANYSDHLVMGERLLTVSCGEGRVNSVLRLYDPSGKVVGEHHTDGCDYLHQLDSVHVVFTNNGSRDAVASDHQNRMCLNLNTITGIATRVPSSVYERPTDTEVKFSVKDDYLRMHTLANDTDAAFCWSRPLSPYDNPYETRASFVNQLLSYCTRFRDARRMTFVPGSADNRILPTTM